MTDSRCHPLAAYEDENKAFAPFLTNKRKSLRRKNTGFHIENVEWVEMRSSQNMSIWNFGR